MKMADIEQVWPHLQRLNFSLDEYGVTAWLSESNKHTLSYKCTFPTWPNNLKESNDACVIVGSTKQKK